jgi:hypothetical protein
MSILGAVTVNTARIVKVVSVAMVALTALMFAFAGWDLMTNQPPLLHEPGAIEKVALSGIGFLACIAGWHFADWLHGKAEVMNNKERQQAELERLQSAHGMAL